MRTIILLFISLDVLAQAEPVLVFRTAQKINFDGKLNDDVWQSATRFPLIRQSPDYGKNPSEKTDFRMLFDDQYVYIGSQNFVSESSRILEFGKLRDGVGPVDWISVAFDGYNDHTNDKPASLTNPALKFETRTHSSPTLATLPLTY